MYGVEAAAASPAKVASLTAAVIDVFKSRNNVHNANQFFATITGNKTISTRKFKSLLEGSCRSGELRVKIRKLHEDLRPRWKATRTRTRGMGSGQVGTDLLMTMIQDNSKVIRVSNPTLPPGSMKPAGTMKYVLWDLSGCSLNL